MIWSRALLTIAVLAPMAACQADETVAAYGGANQTWVLTDINETPFASRATLTFPEPGRIAGVAPCNRYFGTMTVPYPWFSATNVAGTKMACPDLRNETLFLDTLTQMTQAEVAGDTLILRDEAGQEMVFSARD